ncbi:hypothetical protein SO802_006279 [Lithocarpus litseifolius]|uniref:Aminotransferase-like plant mobile domain-containing protein n=1 Tax=Lithocarpus litseifolius TaxID=425828 RepID=A0AAW2DL78_9ROSI
MPLQFLNPISDAKRNSWGSGALAWLYRHLCKASEIKAKQIGGALMLVQLWAYSRFPLICPVTRQPQPPVEASPFARRWKGPKSTAEHATHVLAAYLEKHHPECVFRQFGMKQAPPELVDTSIDLHRISLQGEHVAKAPTLDGDTTYLVAYMELYRRMTRWYITRESVYWDMLVESNVVSLLQCEPGSELYNQLLRMLDLVGELSQVQLENACAASEASTQATGPGGRGGGSGGRGGTGGRRGGRGPAPVSLCSLKDEHESGLKQELKDKDKAHDLNLQVKSEVGRCLALGGTKEEMILTEI